MRAWNQALAVAVATGLVWSSPAKSQGVDEQWRTDVNAFVRLLLRGDLSRKPSSATDQVIAVPDDLRNLVTGVSVTWQLYNWQSSLNAGPILIPARAIENDRKETGLVVVFPRKAGEVEEVLTEIYASAAPNSSFTLIGAIRNFTAAIGKDGKIVATVDLEEARASDIISDPLAGVWQVGGRKAGKGTITLERAPFLDSRKMGRAFRAVTSYSEPPIGGETTVPKLLYAQSDGSFLYCTAGAEKLEEVKYDSICSNSTFCFLHMETFNYLGGTCSSEVSGSPQRYRMTLRK